MLNITISEWNCTPLKVSTGNETIVVIGGASLASQLYRLDEQETLCRKPAGTIITSGTVSPYLWKITLANTSGYIIFTPSTTGEFVNGGLQTTTLGWWSYTAKIFVSQKSNFQKSWITCRVAGCLMSTPCVCQPPLAHGDRRAPFPQAGSRTTGLVCRWNGATVW